MSAVTESRLGRRLRRSAASPSTPSLPPEVPLIDSVGMVTPFVAVGETVTGPGIPPGRRSYQWRLQRILPTHYTLLAGDDDEQLRRDAHCHHLPHALESATVTGDREPQPCRTQARSTPTASSSTPCTLTSTSRSMSGSPTTGRSACRHRSTVPSPKISRTTPRHLLGNGR